MYTTPFHRTFITRYSYKSRLNSLATRQVRNQHKRHPAVIKKKSSPRASQHVARSLFFILFSFFIFFLDLDNKRNTTKYERSILLYSIEEAFAIFFYTIRHTYHFAFDTV